MPRPASSLAGTRHRDGGACPTASRIAHIRHPLYARATPRSPPHCTCRAHNVLSRVPLIMSLMHMHTHARSSGLWTAHASTQPPRRSRTVTLTSGRAGDGAVRTCGGQPARPCASAAQRNAQRPQWRGVARRARSPARVPSAHSTHLLSVPPFWAKPRPAERATSSASHLPNGHPLCPSPPPCCSAQRAISSPSGTPPTAAAAITSIESSGPLGPIFMVSTAALTPQSDGTATDGSVRQRRGLACVSNPRENVAATRVHGEQGYPARRTTRRASVAGVARGARTTASKRGAA